MIPSFDPATGNLPPGVHPATWQEVVARYGLTAHRLALLSGLKAALDALQAAGCQRVYLDGSFVTAKETPADFDGCWEVEGVDLARLNPVLMTFANRREAPKGTFGGEMFPADWPASAHGTNFLQFFQIDKFTNEFKGILAIDLEYFP